MCACVYMYHVHTGASRGQKKASDPLALGLQAIVGAGNQTWVCYERSKHSELSQLSSPRAHF